MDDHGELCVLYIVNVFRDYDHAWVRVIARESHGAEHISAHIVCASVSNRLGILINKPRIMIKK